MREMARQATAKGRLKRIAPRPRRYASPVVLRLGSPLLTYDIWRRGYRLRMIGRSYGPVLVADRRHLDAGYAGQDRRRDGRSGHPGHRHGRVSRFAVAGGVAVLAILGGLAIVLLAPDSPGRAASAPPRVASHTARHHPAVLAAGTVSQTTPAKPAVTAPAHHRRHAAKRPAVRHRRRPPAHRRRAPARRHAPVHTAVTSPSAATTYTTTTTTTPALTTSTPTITTPPPTYTTPPVHTTPAAPVHTTPTTSSPGGVGTSTQPTHGGGTASGSAGGSGTVNGGG